jgi:hypothetical protein
VKSRIRYHIFRFVMKISGKNGELIRGTIEKIIHLDRRSLVLFEGQVGMGVEERDCREGKAAKRFNLIQEIASDRDGKAPVAGTGEIKAAFFTHRECPEGHTVRGGVGGAGRFG